MLSTPSLGITDLERAIELLNEYSPELSTPSLGITYAFKRYSFVAPQQTFNSLSRDHKKYIDAIDQLVRNFQLPLSGSRDHLRRSARERRPGLDFQLPLSGSHALTTKRTEVIVKPWPKLSTPSLGITCSRSGINFDGSRRLSTPSLGITEVHRCVDGRGMRHGTFQLPLSGSHIF